MGFDDRQTEPLVCVGCLAVLCGVLAPVLGKLFGWWAGALTLTPPIALLLVIEIVWRRERQ
jgi:hypothetical protein